MVFVAHPDDEAIGFGGHLDAFADLVIVHATDGAPRNLRDARARGFADAPSYAEVRRKELQSAMSLAGVGESALLCLGYADQDTAHRLVSLTRSFAACLAERRPDIVFTHAYEGGHPDHDAVAFAARAARRLVEQGPLLVEMPLYHSEDGEIVRQRFAPSGQPAAVVPLDDASRRLKRRIYDAYASQRDVLQAFHVEQECFRRADACDFSQAPNGGEVLYDRRDWSCSSAEFVARAQAALAELGLPHSL